jgi:exodeoxyribonuclease VII large subunit
MQRHLKALGESIHAVAQRLKDPRRRIQDHWQRLDDLNGRLARMSRSLVRDRREKLTSTFMRLSAQSPARGVRLLNLKLDSLNNNLLNSYNNYISRQSMHLQAASQRMQALNPEAVLQRGYSITRTIPSFKVVRDPARVSAGQKLDVTVARGHIYCQVEGTKTNGKKNL